MQRKTLVVAIAACLPAVLTPATTHAHALAGARVFPVTLNHRRSGRCR